VLAEIAILLAATVVAVPLFQRLGFGSILGYLAAGVVIGPVLRLFTEPQEIFEVAELGIALFLFIIGLELKPARLWAMRADIFGLGLAQVVVTGFVLTGGLWMVGYRIEPALIIGFGLAMSSTAFGMQILREGAALDRPHGRKAFSILLFQDLAIIPLLALVPLLAPSQPGAEAGAAHGPNLLPIAGALAALVLGGRYVLNPLFRLIAAAGAREVMTAAALLVVLVAGELMVMAGMSMATGAFIAGLILADSSFRHELEANIEPFRGLLFGLFFIAVGLSISVDTVLYSWWRLLLAVPLIMAAKALILYGLARLFGSEHNDAVRVAALLPQAGEFAFVLFASAEATRALWPSHVSFVAAAVTLSMALTPLAVRLGRIFLREPPADAIDEDFEGAGGSVLLIGFGRFGQIVAQVLMSRGVEVTILDNDAERIRQAARFGFRIYFGDGSRRDVLRASGAGDAAVVCVCCGNAAVTSRIVETVRLEFAGPRIYARSQDRAHTLELIARGVDYELRETYESALVFGGEALRELGFDGDEVEETITELKRRDADRIALQASGEAHRRHSPQAEFGPRPLAVRRRATPPAEDDPTDAPAGRERASGGGRPR